MQVADVERGPRDEDDFLRTAVGVLRAVDAGVAYPVRGWACKGCQFAHACGYGHKMTGMRHTACRFPLSSWSGIDAATPPSTDKNAALA